MGTVYWIKRDALNPEELWRFQKVQAHLLQEQQLKGDTEIWQNSQSRSGFVSLEKNNPGAGGFFNYWSQSYTNTALDKEIDYWTIAALLGIRFYFDYRWLSYLNRCGAEQGNMPPPLIPVNLPEKMKGYFLVDWNQDGDQDLAILLAGGRLVFFEQRPCENPTI